MPRKIPINYIKLYKRGMYATYNGSTHIVDHVSLHGHKLLVHFDGSSTGVDSSLVDVAITTIDFNRAPEKKDDDLPDDFL